MRQGNGETRAVVRSTDAEDPPLDRVMRPHSAPQEAPVHDKEWLMQNTATSFAPPPDTAGQLSDIELAVVLAVLTGDSTPLLQLSGSARHR